MIKNSDDDDQSMQDTQDKLADLLNESDKGENSSADRVERIIAKTRMETGIRDLLTHMLIQIWTPLLSLGSALFVVFHKQPDRRE